MKIYNRDKTEILENPDLEQGKLIEDTIHIHEDEIPAIEEESHVETLSVYANGGKDVKRVIDVPAQEYQPAKDYDEEIYVYVPFTEDELLENKKNTLRLRRGAECFPIINRGKLWYNNLTQQQIKELQSWYQAWLDVTKTLKEPDEINWLK